MEKNQKLKILEMTDGLKKCGANTLQPEQMQNKMAWEREKQKYIEVIKRKNREITKFRHELDSLLIQVEELNNK